MNEALTDQIGWVEMVLASVDPGEFAILEFVPAGDADVRPFSQVAHEVDDSWYLEVVSDQYLSRFVWPLDTDALRRDGWHPPDKPDDNWWRYADAADDLHAVALRLLNGLRLGRRCLGEGTFHISVGVFPPNPDGGLPVPVPVVRQELAA